MALTARDNEIKLSSFLFHNANYVLFFSAYWYLAHYRQHPLIWILFSAFCEAVHLLRANKILGKSTKLLALKFITERFPCGDIGFYFNIIF